MASFFDHGLGARVAFLPDLASSGHEDEALTLCLLYIEGLGNSVYDNDTNSMRNFVRIIRDHGGADLLMLIHPGLLLRALPRDGRVAKASVAAMTPVLDARPTDFLDENELMDALAPAALSDEQAEWLRRELWRGTLAGLAYTYMRSPAVHYGLVSKPFFSTSTRHGEPVPPLDLRLLLPVLQSILASVRKLSMDTGAGSGMTRFYAGERRRIRLLPSQA